MIIAFNTQRRTPDGVILPLDPLFARWYERVNEGARFRLDFADRLSGPNGEPFLRLPLVRDGEEGYTFTELALFLYSYGTGALLAQPDGGVGDGTDHLPVTLGDVADFLLTGAMLDRVPATPPWGYPDRFPEDYVGVLHEPDMVTLPYMLRENLAWLFDQTGAADARVSLFEASNGLRSLCVQYAAEQGFTDEQYQAIAARVFWHLPRYYAAVVIPTRNVKGYPILTGRKMS